MAFEPYFTPAQLAHETGFPEHEIRAACKRGTAFHPLPHIRSGKTRPVFRISMSDWLRWLDEEKVR